MRETQGKTVYLKDYRPPEFLIDETHLSFSLHEDSTKVQSRLVMRRNPEGGGGSDLVLDGQDLKLLSLGLDGVQLPATAYSVDEDSLTVRDVPDSFMLECVTEILPQENSSLEGLYKSKRMFCTQCEAEGFRKITYYLDRPDVLSSFTTRIEADREKYPVLLSNGNRIDAGELADGRHWVTWEDPFKKPSYLFALVAGDLQSVDDSFITCSGREVALRIFVEEKDLDKCDFAMASLKKAMRWDEEVYGREYDLDIFMIVAVDDFNMGAMENKGLNIFNSSCVLANPATSTDFSFQRIEAIVAHEYFHNWSGNRVTCRDWFQLSLKEGFTVYRDSEFSADMNSRAVKRIEDVSFLRTVQFAEDAGPMAHSVRPDSYMEISNFYTVTVYEKGAEVVRMIANLLGPETFRLGTDRYFDKFDGMAVTTDDFVATMEEVSGIDLGQFRRWYSQAGTPVLHITRYYDADNRRYTLRVKQQCPPTPRQPEKKPFHIPLAMGLLDSKGREMPLQLAGDDAPADTSLVLPVSADTEEFVFVGVDEDPVPSLLRSFSAPVKLQVDYSRDELMFLVSHDSDGFVRWEAGQMLAVDILQELLTEYRKDRELLIDDRLVQAIGHVLESSLDDPAVDKAMISYLIMLPTEAYLGELAEEVDVDGIHVVREFLRTRLAEALGELLARVFDANSSPEAYVVTAPAIARRQLKNTALNYLLLLDDPVWFDRCLAQYREADNMTDTSAALRTLVNSRSPLAGAVRQEALDGFYRRWQHEPLVVEQWLAMQCAASDADNLPRVKALMQHEAFSIKNPNKVRAVIGAFCNQNLVGFHREDGSGYEFLADTVITLNGINPQIASRLMTPLTRWRKYNEKRQGLMKEQLKRILALENLSRDVYEVTSKSLAD